jgi:molecular chaperone GrpE
MQKESKADNPSNESVEAQTPVDEQAKESTTTAEVNPEAEEVPLELSENEASMEDKLKDQLMRALADAENTRKRAQKEVDDAYKYAVGNFAKDLVAVLENLYRAEESIPAEEAEKNELFSNLYKGVEMTKNEFIRVFEKHGLKRINPMGEKFDHNLHQAVAQIPDAEHEEGTVVQVLQAGYILQDRLIQPAMVGVAKKA